MHPMCFPEEKITHVSTVTEKYESTQGHQNRQLKLIQTKGNVRFWIGFWIRKKTEVGKLVKFEYIKSGGWLIVRYPC